MLKTRVIPVLLLRGSGLVKGAKFKDHKYVGDPINAVKIFNDKEVDELVFLDIDATENKTGPNYELLEDIASEAFVPFAYGGGVNSLDQAARLFKLGVEKVIINTAAFENPTLIQELAQQFGSQSIVVCIDVKKNLWGKQEVYVHNGKVKTKQNPIEYALKMQALGAGELIVSSIDKDGTRSGYDMSLLQSITDKVNLPVVALGGASSLDDLKLAVSEAHVSAVAAGDMFVFSGKHKAVLITYPPYHKLEELFQKVKIK
jgi:imidazole glycerol-phosphate synthase subunit HisF